MRKIIVFVLVMLVLLSCEQKSERTEINCVFQLPGKDVFVKTSKRKGGKFVIFFALDSLMLKNSQDSIEFQTGGYIYMFMDTTNVYIKEYAAPIQHIQHQHFNFQMISFSDYDRFSENGKQIEPYSYINIDTGEYHVAVDQQVIRKGELYGGW